MPLRDLTNQPKIITRPCNESQEESNWRAAKENFDNINNNLTLIQEANGLPNLNIDASDAATLPMQARWAISLGDTPGDDENFIEPVADNNWRGMVRALPCDTSGGKNPNPTPIWVILPERDGASINLPRGAVFAYELTSSGEYVAVSDYSAGLQVFWGVAQGNSTSGDPGEVTVRQCDDAAGNNPVLPNITVKLPQHNGSIPDVITGDVIAYTTTTDGTYVCVSDYTDIQTIYRFELTAGLTPGNTAAGEFVVWNGAAYVTNGVALTVRDANSPGRWRGASGYRGLCAYFEDRNSYEIIFMEEIAEYAIVTLAERMGASTAGVSELAVVESYWNGNNPGGFVNVYDEEDLWRYAMDGMKMMVHYDWTNGRYKPIGFDNRIFYVIAQHNWRLDSTVSVKLWNGAAAVGAAFFAKLSYAGVSGAHHGDPNVVKGDVLMCMVDKNNDPVIIDPMAWDQPIGSVKGWIKAYNDDPDNLGGTDGGTYFSGWGLMNAVANSSGNGGSGRDWQDFFLRGAQGTGVPSTTAFGEDRHTHIVSLLYAYTGITVSVTAHPSHVHKMLSHCGTCQLAADGGGQSTYLITGFVDDHVSGPNAWTGIQKLASSSHSSDHDDLTLDHEVYTLDPGHTHTAVVGDAPNFPPYKEVHWLERVDNSFDTIGV